jgi:hypothetical protein
MQVTSDKILLLLAGLIILPQVYGQIEITNMDSLPLLKPGRHENLYNFTDHGSKEIKFEQNPDAFVKTDINPNLKDVGNFSLTLITGFGFNSSADGYWKVSGTIQCNDTLPYWSVFLYCGGRIDKTRERVKDEDGSWSVETQKTNYFFWNEDAGGIIIEGLDTIGNFFINMDPAKNELFNKWSANILSQQKVESGTGSGSTAIPIIYNATGKDYEVSGKFRNTNFTLIQNGNNRKVWIFIDNLLVGVFQGDIDYPGVKKKYRNSPFILVENDTIVVKKRDIIRLAVMSRYLNNYLSRY